MGNKRSRDYEEVEELDEIDDDDYELDEELIYARRKRNQKIIIAIFVVIIIMIASFYLLVVSPEGVLGIYPGDPELNSDKDGLKIQADVAMRGTGSAKGDGKVEVFLDGKKTYSKKISVNNGVASTELKFIDFVTENGDYDIKISFEDKSAYMDSPYEINWVVEKPEVKLRRMVFTETQNLTKFDKPYLYVDINMKDEIGNNNDRPVFKVGPLKIEIALKYETQQTPFITDTFNVDNEFDTIVTKKYNYNTAGNVTAEVTVTNSHVKSDSNYKEVSGNNEVPTLINAPPVAFAVETDGKVNLLIDNGLAEFDASESFDLDGSIVEYQWDFGDGSDDNVITTTIPTATHQYTEQNTFPVTVTVIDNYGGIDPQGFDIYIFTITVTRL